jgi:hypothetical protein
MLCYKLFVVNNFTQYILKIVVNNLERRNFAFSNLIMNLSFKNMKKAVIVLATFIAVVILASSCMSSQRCAAYGERYKYQVERR